ncbi:signal peptidase I [Niallia sp. Krafla_26]|uniref:signal peptidase I n=1 Tax=Niallia sp. Krafla_26 TaxID=3064703 RepID=UPI003D1849E5
MSKKVIKRIVYTLFIGFLFISFYLTFSSKLTGVTPQIAGYQLITILSGSMEPTIKPGSLILIKVIDDPHRLKVNDIITFHSPRNHNELITHRIVEIDKQNSEIYFTTKGDSNKTIDTKTVEGMNVYAKYQNIHIPFAGYLLHFSKSKIGFILFFLIPVITLIFTSIGSFRSPLKRRQVSDVERQICSEEQVMK